MKSWLFSSQQRFCPSSKNFTLPAFLLGYFFFQCGGKGQGQEQGLFPHLSTLVLMQGTNIWASSRGFFSLGGAKVEGERTRKWRSQWEGQAKKVSSRGQALAEPMAGRNCSSVLGRKEDRHWRTPKKCPECFPSSSSQVQDEAALLTWTSSGRPKPLVFPPKG